MIFTKKQIINKTKAAFNIYREFEDKTYRYIYYDNKSRLYKEMAVFYGKDNFLHLTGVKYKGENNRALNATDFYSLLESQIELEEDKIITNNETQLKLEVITQISELKNCHSLKIIDNKIHMLKGQHDGALRSKRKGFALGFHQQGNKKFPKTLLNLRTMGKFENGVSVLCIYIPSSSDASYRIVCKSASFDDLFKNSPYQFK